MVRYFAELNDENLTFPCGNSKQKATRCSIGNFKIHIKCNKIDDATIDKKTKIICVLSIGNYRISKSL